MPEEKKNNSFLILGVMLLIVLIVAYVSFKYINNRKTQDPMDYPATAENPTAPKPLPILNQ